jgi:hypothetical protein
MPTRSLVRDLDRAGVCPAGKERDLAAPKVRAPEFVSGENFSYLGQNYRLKIVRDAAEPLRFDGNHFWLAETHEAKQRRISAAGMSVPGAAG